MKKLFKNQKETLYKISKETGIPIATLYRYAEKRTDVNKMPMDLVIKLAYYFHIEVNMFYYNIQKYLR